MTEATAPKKPLKPIVIRNNKKMVIKSPKLFNVKMPVMAVQQFKDEVIYSKPNCDFLKGDSQDVLIVNRMNLLNKSCRTVARCTNRGTCVETTSDNVVSTIGQQNYETVLSALSSVFNEETKVRGILSLLSVPRKFDTVATQTTMEITEVKKKSVTVACQTNDSRVDTFIKERQKKRIRRIHLTPYVVTDQPKVKKFVVNPDDVKQDLKRRKIEENVKKFKEKPLPDLREAIDEDSNISCVSNLTASSWPSVPGILENTNEFLNQIDKVTDKTLNSTEIRLRDGSVIMIPVKPEDDFHIATPEVLKNVTNEERMKLIVHQAFIDFRMCLVQDEDGYYPLHVAVLTSDVDLVRRQCAALRARHESVDIIAAGLSALHMAVRQNAINCANILLQNGADPLLCDPERRCSLHLAAEMESPLLSNLLAYCDSHARDILKNNQKYWKPDFESKLDAELKTILYNCVSEMFDEQGNNPLMVASESAIAANVFLLARRSGSLIDLPAPGSGSTALYIATTTACLHAKETGNMTTIPEKFLSTVEILVEHGADPSIENHAGSSVNTLLTEFNISSLSMTIANKMTALRHGKYTDRLNMVLYKNNDGTIGYRHINEVSNRNVTKRTVDSGLHAVITVNVPEKRPDKEVSIDSAEIDIAAVISNASTIEVDNEIEVKEDSEDCVIDDVKDEVVNEISDNEIDNNFTEINNETQNAIENKDIKTEVKQEEVVKPKIILNSTLGGIDTSDVIKFETPNALKRNLNKAKDGNAGNITITRLSSGQMVAITTESVEPETQNKTFSLIKFDQTSLNDIYIKKKTTKKTKIVAEKVKPQVKKGRKRKSDKVVIVEDISLNAGYPIDYMNPGTSKIANGIFISPQESIPPNLRPKEPKVNEPTIDAISRKLFIGLPELPDYENVKRFKETGIFSE